MRIGLIIYGSLDTVSGGYLYDRQLVQALRDAGDHVEVISLPWQAYDRCLLHNLRPSLLHRMRRGSYDILLQDELCHPSLYLINRHLRRHVSAPLISIVHHLRSSERHLQVQLPRYRRIERAYLRAVDGFIYNSETTRMATEALSGVSRPHVVAYPAADHVDENPNNEQTPGRKPQDDRLHLIFVGNVIPRKGLHTLLEALGQLAADSWRLSIIGDLSVDPRYAARLQTVVDESLPAANVTWYGRVVDAALWRLMAEGDLLVVPSTYEGFGIVYLEGMAFGLPAVATLAGAAGESITDGESGFLIEADDAGELAYRLRLLARDRRLLARMSKAARARYQAAPTWAQSMSRVRRFLRSWAV